LFGMAELVYPPVVRTALAFFRVMDVRIDLRGAEHVPVEGGAVLACNHVGYLDFVFCGLPAWRRSRRLVRFLAKREVFAHPVAGRLMRGMHHISVDRDAGSSSYREAVAALQAGELVGMFPEATISRSFCLKEFKLGAARMALEAGVPLVPVIVWGTQRMLTKDRPKNLRRHLPVVVVVGGPLLPREGEDAGALTLRLKDAMQDLLDQAQAAYPEPVGPDDWWQPAHLGGAAPTPEEAKALEDADVARRRARRAAAAGD
jgi:1-acyl-sn-glycerol-3-phosphate acyltransferase